MHIRRAGYPVVNMNVKFSPTISGNYIHLPWNLKEDTRTAQHDRNVYHTEGSFIDKSEVSLLIGWTHSSIIEKVIQERLICC